MKKLISFILAAIILSSLSSCALRDSNIEESSSQDSQTPTQTEKSSTTAPEPEKETAAETTASDAAFVPISIYLMKSGAKGQPEEYERKTEIAYDLSGGRDLCCIAVFPSEENSISGKNFPEIWQSTLEKAPMAAECKIGYAISFNTPEGSCSRTILKPDDIISTDKFWNYLEMYIYDDVNHDPTQWYSHLLQSEMTDSTVITSFKITAGKNFSGVTDISLSAFLYSSADDFDSKGNYTGKNIATVSVVPG